MSSDDFEDDQIDFEDGGDDGGFEDFEGGGSSLGDMWRNNPLVKIGVIAGGLITIIGAIILFGGSPDLQQRSVVRGNTAASVKGGVGERGLTEEMKDRLQEENEARIETAVRTGDSAIPTPIESPVTRLAVPDTEVAGEDPLERWRRIQEERQRQVSQRTTEVIDTNPHAETIDALANAIATQMEGILQSKEPIEMIHIDVTDPDYLERLRAEEAKRKAETLAALKEITGETEEIVNILIPAGEIEYGQLLIEANSDIDDGPVLAYLASGPLSGAKLLGTFEVEDEHLVLSFNMIVIDGISHQTTAIALDPDTTLPAMATDIDHRYFTRIILPAAASFVEGVGEAIGSTNQTNVTVSDGAAVSSQEELDTNEEFAKGFEKAAETVSEILEENAENTDPLIRVRAGTPMGILFLEPVTDETS